MCCSVLQCVAVCCSVLPLIVVRVCFILYWAVEVHSFDALIWCTSCWGALYLSFSVKKKTEWNIQVHQEKKNRKWNIQMHLNTQGLTLQCFEMHFNILQHTSTHCNISSLHHTATHCNTLQHATFPWGHIGLNRVRLIVGDDFVSRCILTHCNPLQHTATYTLCNTLTTHCNV